jgi:hypothetical protein
MPVTCLPVGSAEVFIVSSLIVGPDSTIFVARVVMGRA